MFTTQFLLANNSFAQYKIQGILAPETEAPISVTLKNSAGFLVLTKTDSQGKFSFTNVSKGNYMLVFSAVNFKTMQSVLALKSDTTISLSLTKTSIDLQDVNINYKKGVIERKIDRTVFNVDRSIAAIGTDALELMAKIPGVRVVNDRVSLIGKAGVNIMINDKLTPLTEDDLANYLRSIPADQISKIELISNPAAKYDAQGNNGLINIVLKKNVAEGFKGAANLGLTQAIYPTGSAAGNLSFKKDKITLFTNFNFRKGSSVPLEQSNVYYPNQTWNVVNKDRNFRVMPSGQIGMDYQPAKNTLIGLSYNSGQTNFHSEEHIKTTVFNKIPGIDSVLNSEANAKMKSNYHAANLYLKQSIDSLGKQLTINADWFKYTDDKQRFFDNTSYEGTGQMIPNSFAQYLSSSLQHIDLYTLKADLELPYKTFNLSMGTKVSFVKNESEVSFFKKANGIYEVDASQSNQFNYSENTQALYLNLNKTIRKWDFQAGLRAEYTQTAGVSLDATTSTDYLRWFPTLFMVYHWREKNEFSLNYGRRINRPAYKKLNPFRWYTNQFSYAEGNPFLQPSYNNNIELAHTYARVFTSTISFSNTNNGFNDLNFTEPNTNIQILKPVNLITSYHYQLSNTMVLNPFQWLESMYQLDVFYTRSKSAIEQTIPGLNGFGAYFSTLNQLVLNKSKTLMADVNFWYQFPGINGLNQMKSQYSLDIGVKKLLLAKKLQVALNASDLLKSQKDRYTAVVNNIRQEYKNYYDSQYLRLTIRYNFGNEKMKQQVRKPGNEEERQRSN
ncbi:outer membrane beta-barrel protein [Pedobacter gandavensis]|uniref:outer membrane beta-barrel protein n=1 Tax=Pedobacter gandavensis TaxID=2679963 RepID=UPI00160200B7|nr:outer membrane beta-barrel protein [Pedobacter gandavensis]